ncbi:hypothetical protein [Sphingomonas faeni]|uniref:hypothetical protein n=1 Tax=Sphingomonas faeni TaxID=185950 RepID=UPI00277EC1AD|nr:hypothetical protein [Sphingomonas faeni]MDQ0840298.1 hypothetical protein [Sphingomonas faeni]
MEVLMGIAPEDEGKGEIVPPPPRSWLNWQAHREKSGAIQISELRLYSDAEFIAEAYDFGPYSFLNALAHTRANVRSLKPGIVLRAEWLLKADMRVPFHTNDNHYHGGDIFDEVAALVSLLLDARIMAGPVDREFKPGEDPLGRPRGYDATYLPLLPISQRAPQLPHLHGMRDLRSLADFATLPLLTPDGAAALIKAARLFQNALWVADSTPENAWLLLVSSIETAANHWDGDQRSPEERFALSYQGVINLLHKAGAGATVPKVARAFRGVVGATAKFVGSTRPRSAKFVGARAFRGVVGATAKFVGFMETFAPGAPEKRPTFGKFNFSSEPLTAAYKRIYALRSRALHGGVPFPYPMCIPPERYDDGPYSEIPGGLACSAMGATWSSDDTPMLLHTFAYLARGALLAWWHTLVPTDATRADPPFTEILSVRPVADRFCPFPLTTPTHPDETVG